MATAVVVFKVIDGFTPEMAERFIDRMRNPPGLRTCLWAPTLENFKTYIGIFNWDSEEEIANFRRLDPSVKTKLQALCTEPMNVFHTHLQPFPPSELSQAEVVQVASITKKPEVSKDQFETAFNYFFERVQRTSGYRCHFRGMKREDSTGNTYVTFVGWESMESYSVIRSDEDLDQLRAVAGLTVDEESFVYHLRLHLY